MINKFEAASVYPALRNFKKVCDVPPELGPVEKIEVRNGKVVATTQSGIKLIVPSGNDRLPPA